MVRAVKMAVDAGVAQTGDTLLVQSDCRQVEAVLWHERLSEPGTERHRIETLARDVLRRLCERFDVTCRFRHVKAHNGRAEGRRSFLNERCDAVAKHHMKRARTRWAPQSA